VVSFPAGLVLGHVSHPRCSKTCDILKWPATYTSLHRLHAELLQFQALHLSELLAAISSQ